MSCEGDVLCGIFIIAVINETIRLYGKALPISDTATAAATTTATVISLENQVKQTNERNTLSQDVADASDREDIDQILSTGM